MAKLYMTLEGETVQDFYDQLMSLRVEDSKEEVWALAEKEAKKTKKQDRLKARTWHALEKNWKWTCTRVSTSAGANTPV
jgi:hypothetical protein